MLQFLERYVRLRPRREDLNPKEQRHEGAGKKKFSSAFLNFESWCLCGENLPFLIFATWRLGVRMLSVLIFVKINDIGR
jgi:hypothetical protein